MKYAFMSFSEPQLSAEGLAETSKRLGYRGVEPRLGSNHGHGIENGILKQAADKVKDIFSGHGIDICCLATSCIFTDPKTLQENIENAKKTVELAIMLGVRRIRVFGGTIPDGISRGDAAKTVTESLLNLSDFIGQEDLALCMETHDSWCDPDEVAAIMTSVSRKNIMVNWDIMHPVLTAGKTIKEAYEVLKPWIGHVHVHDGVREDGKIIFKPIGQGLVDHKTAINLLRDSGYDDYISGEWIQYGNPEFEENHLEREIKLLKAL